MPRKEKDSGDPEVWMEYAEADLALAKIPLPSGTKYEQLCFLAQQAAEKSLKAVLLKLDVDFPPTHNLQLLVDLLPQKVSRNLTLVAVPRLTVYATTFRYPGELVPVSQKEYREAVRIAEAIVEWAKGIIGT